MGKDITQTFSNNASTGTTSSTVRAPAWQKAHGKKLFLDARKKTPKTFKPYAGPRVAGYGQGYEDSKGTLAGMKATTGWNYGNNRSRLDELYNSQKGALGKTAADYINPYIGKVLEPTLRGIDEQRQAQGREINRDATMAGAFGDPQRGIRRAVSDNKFNTQASDATHRAYSDGWDRGQTQHNTELQRLMQMPSMYQSLDQQNFDQNAAIGKAEANFGVADQALQQKHHDVAYDNWLKKRGFGLERSQALMQPAAHRRRAAPAPAPTSRNRRPRSGRSSARSAAPSRAAGPAAASRTRSDKDF
jgi:hypothetical protein